MKLSQASLSLLQDCICKAVNKYNHAGGQAGVTDIHFQPIQASGELTIFDDDDTRLATTVIEEWMAYDGQDFYADVECTLTRLLAEEKKKGAIDALNILKPYSFVLVDEERETVAEMLLVDDDTLFVNDELLKGLDDELDSFLKELLEK